MNDPYQTLGVSSNASDDEVKRAYRELARKYHPDNYQNNPLADLAEEKMKAINEAYDVVNKMRSGGGTAGGYRTPGGQSYQQQQYQYGGGTQYAKIRQAINRGDFVLAEQLLNAENNHGGEWHFLMGSVAYRKGWLDEARQQFKIATEMEPGNTEYRQAYQMMTQGGGSYRPGGYVGGNEMCDCCTTMMCLQCLCGGCG